MENDRKNRTRRLIQLGALAEKYLHCEGVSPEGFEERVKQLTELEVLLAQSARELSQARMEYMLAQRSCDEYVKLLAAAQGKEQAADEKAQRLQKALLLACRTLADYFYLPGQDDDESERVRTTRWYDQLMEQAASEEVCRVCGCTEENACGDGCYWVEDDLCSSCADADGPEIGAVEYGLDN